MSEQAENMLTALNDAVKAAGSEARLAEEINLRRPDDAKWKPQTRSHVNSWRVRDGGKCPPHLVLIVEDATGISRHRLRPDVFGEAPIPAPEERQPERVP